MAVREHVEHGFDPVFDDASSVLVLGSFPSVLSRENHFYYGNPRNRFWKVICALYGREVPEDSDIDAKRQLLLDCGIALWDVVASCDIKGSSDASIENVVPNNVGVILDSCDIRLMIANGNTAGVLYHRHLESSTGRKITVLPSTSPANAAWSLDRLVGRWGEALVGEGPTF